MKKSYMNLSVGTPWVGQTVSLHGLEGFGSHQMLCHLLFGFLAFSAFSELLRHDFMTVNNWRIVAIVLTGVYGLGSTGIYLRVLGDRNNSDQPTAPSHHHPFYTHISMALLCKVLVMVSLIVFYADHEKDLPTFNAHRYSNGIPLGLEAMYVQWQITMLLTLLGWIISTITLSRMYMRMKDPRVMDAETAAKFKAGGTAGAFGAVAGSLPPKSSTVY